MSTGTVPAATRSDDAKEYPALYGTPIEESRRGYGRVFGEEGRLPYAYVHYLNGTIEGWG